MKNVLLVCACLLFLFATFDLFLKEPPVWPDEAGLARYSILAGKNPMHYYEYYPSIYIVILSGWFNTFGSSIISQRALSLIAGIFIFFIFVLISKNIHLKNNFLSKVGLIFILTDFTFLQATRVGRPEIWTLLLGLTSIYFLQALLNSNYKKFTYLFISVIFAISAFAFHINGFIYPLTILIIFFISMKKLFGIGKKILLMVVLLSPFFILMITHITVFLSFILLRLKIGNAQDTWIYTVFSSKPLELKLIYLSFIAISILILLYFIRKREKDLLIIIIPLILSWAVCFFNKDFWYAVYLVPPVLLALVFLLDKTLESWKLTKSFSSTVKFFGLVFISSVLFLSNFKFHLDILLSEGGERYSYDQYISDIQKTIPEGKTVFNSAIPDSYYAFINRKNNKFYSFPQSFSEKSVYMEQLNATDFIIFNGSYGDNYYGDIVIRYIEKNKLNITLIGTQYQYQAYIVELKLIRQRTDPNE